jgi:hypothetical protein
VILALRAGMHRALHALFAVILFASKQALADATVPNAPTPASDQTTDSAVPSEKGSAEPRASRPKYGYWSVGEPRFFVSTKSDVGTIYTKPYFSAGYGLPHWIWTGIDVNAITTTEFGQVYVGARGATPLFDLAFGFRDTYAYWKPFLEPRASFVADDLDVAGPNARYWAWEGEAVATIPLPHSALVLDYIAVGMLDKPPGRYVYDESYRAIVASNFFQVFRLAAVARLLREDALKVGVLGELVTTTGRGKPVFRLGPAGALQLTDHLELLGTLTLCVSSPDSLGLKLGAYGVAGFRYRWATGEASPMAPWRGDLIP